ncbi:uncharacterized protein LOC110449625 [Mizuhopecten yessoensis]|uniref:uncharacterized protein LOC110449625 n=1 Tax=Mizuhopecten yessoensis TaxID=6573 RepID=UPI000B45AC16|nr:uncharacterized protein LOC110449625 [Mizuhopecten yessoensis]
MTTWTTYSLFAPFLGDTDKQHLCGSPSTSLGRCVISATVGCSKTIDQHFDMMRYLAWTGLHMTGLCEENVYTCSAPEAVQCMNELGFLIGQNSAMLDHTSSMNDDPDVCSVYKRSRDCMTRYLYRCGATKKQSVQKTFEELECLMGNQCEIIEDPPVTEKPADCIDITVTSDGSRCALADAMRCFDDLRWNIASPFSRAGSICSSYSKSVQCFADNVSGCLTAVEDQAKTALEEFAPFVSGCPTKIRSPCQEEEDLCKYTELTACVNVVRELMLTSVEDAQLCVAFSSAWDCINTKSTDCPSNHVMSIQQTLNALHNQISFLTCEDNIQVCYYKYIDIVEEILTKQPNAVAPETSGSGSKKASGSGSKKASGSGSKKASGSASKKASGSGSKKASGSGSKSASRSARSASKQASGSGSKKASGSASKKPSGSESKPASGSPEVWDNSASCNDIADAYSCMTDKLPSSGLPKALIRMVESVIGDLYSITDEKCQGMTCYYCKKKKSNGECNQGLSICSASQQACQTVVEKDKITKGCVAPDKCKAGTKGKKTTYCCYGHLCNEPGDMVYDDPPTCDILIHSRIVISLLTKVIEASNAYSTVFCSNVLLTLKELTTVSSTCSVLTGDKMRALQSRLLTAEESMCTIQVVCKRQLALDSIYGFNTTIHSSASSDLICTEYQKTMQYLFTEWSTCGNSEIAEMQTILDSVTASVDLTCQLMPAIEYTLPSDVIRIVEGGEAKIIEFVLKEDPATKCNKNSCHVVISMVIVHTGKDTMRTCADNSLIPQLVIGDYSTAGLCGHNFTADNWATKVSVPFVAVSDGLYDGEQTVEVEVTATKYEDDISVLVRKIATYQFVVIDGDKKGSVCTSINDPHILTFDKLYYENFYQGEFVLYRHTTLPYEVRVVFTKCFKATCNCAVMVKSGDDFLNVDVCSSSTIKIAMHFTNQLTVGTQMFIIPSGEKYQQFEVMLPTGTKVVAQVLRGLINVQITPSPSDSGRTEGLCGNFDGDPTNDLMMPDGTQEQVDAKYLKANRANSKDSLFPNLFNKAWQIKDNYWYFKDYPLQPSPEQNPVYCTCPVSASGTADPCQSIPHAKTCPFLIPGIDLIAKAKSLISDTSQNALDQTTVRRRRRQTAATGLEQIGVVEDAEVPAASWPSGNWTEAMAQAHCEALLTNSNLGQSCAGVDVANGTDVGACMADIQRTGGTEYDSFSTTNQMGRCINELSKDPTFNTDPAAQAVATGILDQTCEDNCNTNGDCQKGVCRCYTGFMGVSCSMREGEPPVVAGLQQNTCDTRTGAACNSVSVEGEKFVDLPTLTCHFETVERIAGVFLKTGSETTALANFISFNLAECEIPASLTPAVPLRAVLVSVSNNGVTKSTGDHYFIGHNSQCYTCGDTSCQTTLTGCVIESQCYGIGDVSSANPCHFCDPVTSVIDWTVKIAHYCPDATTTTTTTPGPTTTAPTTVAPATQAPSRDDPAAQQAESAVPIIITGIVAGVAFLALVVVTSVFLIYRKRNSMLKDRRLRESDSESSSGSGSRPGWGKTHRNPDLYYDNSAYHYHYGYNDPQEAFANNIPKRQSQMSRRDPTLNHSDSRS